jgi:hypothetical protein
VNSAFLGKLAAANFAAAAASVTDRSSRVKVFALLLIFLV